MATFKTKHYSFEYDPAMVQPVKITNNDGTRFFVMANELMSFIRFVAREKTIKALQELQDEEGK